MSNLVVSFCILVMTVLPLRAADIEQISELSKALGLAEIIEIMREEGVGYGDELAKDMFPDRVSPEWTAIVEQIYDGEWMSETITLGLSDALANTDVTPLTSFFSNDLGKQIVALEISARRALMDSSVEEGSKEKLAILVESDDPRIELVGRYVDANDLLENNIVGTMNSNFAFYTALAESGAFDDNLTEQQILKDVWNQEPEIRADTEEWLFSYLVMAYQPLGDSDLEGYIALSKTPQGQDLNNALFSAFDQMFTEMSRSLGRSVAMFMAGEDL